MTKNSGFLCQSASVKSKVIAGEYSFLRGSAGFPIRLDLGDISLFLMHFGNCLSIAWSAYAFSNTQSHIVTLHDKETIESISSIRIPIKGFPIPIDSIAAL